jgi:hypothetical protein
MGLAHASGWPSSKGLAPDVFGQGRVPPRRPLHVHRPRGRRVRGGARGPCWGRRLPAAGRAGPCASVYHGRQGHFTSNQVGQQARVLGPCFLRSCRFFSKTASSQSEIAFHGLGRISEQIEWCSTALEEAKASASLASILAARTPGLKEVKGLTVLGGEVGRRPHAQDEDAHHLAVLG